MTSVTYAAQETRVDPLNHLDQLDAHLDLRSYSCRLGFHAGQPALPCRASYILAVSEDVSAVEWDSWVSGNPGSKGWVAVMPNPPSVALCSVSSRVFSSALPSHHLGLFSGD